MVAHGIHVSHFDQPLDCLKATMYNYAEGLVEYNFIFISLGSTPKRDFARLHNKCIFKGTGKLFSSFILFSFYFAIYKQYVRGTATLCTPQYLVLFIIFIIHIIFYFSCSDGYVVISWHSLNCIY